jgi:hypothetical protein
MSAQDRIATGRQPNFDLDYRIGYQGELWIARVADSMTDGARFEVKNDVRAAGTGNFYLEYECRISGQWVPSGFARITPDSSELVSLIVGNSVVVTAPRDLIVEVARKYWQDPANRRMGGMDGSNPTKGVVIPIGALVPELAAAAR